MKKISFLLGLLLCVSIFAQEERNTRQNDMPSANTIGVTIGGNFLVTGTFPSFLNERLDQFVTRMYNQGLQNVQLRPERHRVLEAELRNYSLRNIKLKRINGEELTIDLLKFRRTGDYAHNPYLKHDDVIIFPSTDLERNFVTISGAVMKPGKFHYMEGDRLNDIIELAEGINQAYEDITIRIYRQNYDGSKTDVIKAEINENPVLQRGDRVMLTADEPQKKDFNVIVIGEVNNPGKIPISKNATTLPEVIERAGGLKSTASLKTSRLYTGNTAAYILEKIHGVNNPVQEFFDYERVMIRREVNEAEGMMMYRLSSMTNEDTAYFTIENSLRLLFEGTSFDLRELDQAASAAGSYIVKDGDLIIIPEKPTTVYLFGNVVKPGHINYEEGRNTEYYINKAGGLGEYAEKDEIVVIKGDTREWIPLKNNPIVEEGDYIYVPRDEPRTFNYYVELYGRYLGILGSAATVILLLVQFGK